MNRKEAIKILEHSGDYVGLLPSEFWNSDDGICEAIDMAIEALQDDWIPVSEGLPEVGEYVLASVHDDYADCNIIINKYGEQAFWSNGRITAWRSLPEPYMGGDTE